MGKAGVSRTATIVTDQITPSVGQGVTELLFHRSVTLSSEF